MMRRRGFTYVELIIVATLIALLVAIAVPNFLEAKTRAAVTRSRADMNLVKMAIEAYRLETRSYPLNRTPGETDPRDLLVLTTPIPYISSLPFDFFTTLESKGLRDDWKIEPLPYRYFNGAQLDPEEGVRFAPPPEIDPSGQLAPPSEIDPSFAGFTAALIWGFGPGVDAEGNPDTSPTSIAPTGELTTLPYSSTNGTASPGHLYLRVP